MKSMSEQLNQLLPSISIYPKGVVCAICPKIRGRSFFPGGCGLGLGDQFPFPSRPIMLVGQDFGTRSYWEGLAQQQLDDGEPDNEGTWAQIKKWVSLSLLPIERCFFTNALLGVRDDVSDPSVKIDGPSPGLDYEPYVSASVNCLMEQILLLRPTVVVALGVTPTTLIARRLNLVSEHWPSLKPRRADKMAMWKQIDTAGLRFVEQVRIDGIGSVAFASSVHPDRYWLHIRSRWGPNSPPDYQLNLHITMWRQICEHDQTVRSLPSCSS